MKHASLFTLFLALSPACGPGATSIEEAASPLVGVMNYGNCTSAEVTKLNAAVQILVEITGTRYSGPGAEYARYEACLAPSREFGAQPCRAP